MHFISAGRDVASEGGASSEATATGREERETGGGARPTEVHGQEGRSSRVETGSPPVVMTDPPKLQVISVKDVNRVSPGPFPDFSFLSGKKKKEAGW